MDWTPIISALGGSAIFTVILGFLLKTWIGSRIEESVKLECSKELADYKADLDKKSVKSKQESDLKHESTVARNDADKALLKELLELIPPESELTIFFKGGTVSAPFQMHTLDPMYDFHTHWADVKHEFFNIKIEEKKKIFYDNIHNFRMFIGQNVFHCKIAGGHHSIPKDWAYSDSERYHSLLKEADSLIDKVYDSYQDLIRTAKNELIV